jgi:hypothetical protein
MGLGKVCYIASTLKGLGLNSPREAILFKVFKAALPLILFTSVFYL